jgi:deoxyribodipyrimidine photo-lyase
LSVSSEKGDLTPVFVVDPWFYREKSNCDGRVEFVFSSVESLKQEYGSLGGDLIVLHGESIERLRELSEELGEDVYYNKGVNAGYPRERDARAEEVGFVGIGDDGIVRERDSRDGWSEHVESWFNSETHETPESIETRETEGDISINEARDEYGIDPEKPVPEAGEGAALQGLEDFLDGIEEYPSIISPPYDAENGGTSHLSPYLSVGSLSLRRAYQRAVQKASEPDTDKGPVEMFVERLFWNRHFTQKLQDNPSLPHESVNPVYRGMNRNSHDEGLVEAWKRGETGYPLVDASMRALTRKGWLNFRTRAMVATFFVYILKQPWWIGADHMRRHLIDGDTAINYAQWQMQAGLVGVHPNRIYNPTKQAREKDPEGRYIRRYVPELKDVPKEHLAEPWKMPEEVQRESGVRVGAEYPEPVVEFDDERRRAREAYGDLADRAREALSDPEVYRMASLSQRGDRDELTETSYPEPEEKDEQTSLSRFGDG